MATFVFILCALTSLACSVLLLRAHRRTKDPPSALERHLLHRPDT